jgi:hypothetical protein
MTQALINFDRAWGLSPATDLLVELWPQSGATGLMVHWDTRTARVLEGCANIEMAIPIARTPQGAVLGARILSCQQRHGAAAFFLPNGTAICHDCNSPFLWMVTWHQEGGGDNGPNRATD